MLVMKNKVLIFIFIIFSQLSYANEYKSEELDILFQKLLKINDPYLASLLEREIWKIWSKHPKDKKLTNKLELGKELMNEGSYKYALKVFTNVIKSDPQWSEAWNARATLLYYMKDYQRSLSDIDEVLLLEPRHFGALSGRAQISIKLKKYEKAINDLLKVKEINPSSRGDQLIEKLKGLIKGLDI